MANFIWFSKKEYVIVVEKRKLNDFFNQKLDIDFKKWVLIYLLCIFMANEYLLIRAPNPSNIFYIIILK